MRGAASDTTNTTTAAAVVVCEQKQQQQHEVSKGRSSVEKVWKETQQLMDECEHLVRVMTHVCSQQLSGVFRTVAKYYSQGCWRRCSAERSGGPERANHQHHHHHHHEHHWWCCEGCEGPCRNHHHGAGEHRQPPGHHQQHTGHHHHHQEGYHQEVCGWRGEEGPRWRRATRCEHCENSCNNVVDSGGSAGPPPPSLPSHTIATTTAHHCCCPTPVPSTTTSTTLSSKCRRGMPSYQSLITVLLLLVVTLARFTEGCSSRATPKPRPPSPTMRPNITFQTYACPPAYAAWYCLNGATCFTVKIGESILYNCECADGYMGQRCEFKDLDGSYLPAREKVLLETASIAGGATVACVLVFVVLFALYVFMQKDKEKNCRDLDGGQENDSDRQPFSGYQNRTEVFHNPYARTIEVT